MLFMSGFVSTMERSRCAKTLSTVKTFLCISNEMFLQQNQNKWKKRKHIQTAKKKKTELCFRFNHRSVWRHLWARATTRLNSMCVTEANVTHIRCLQNGHRHKSYRYTDAIISRHQLILITLSLNINRTNSRTTIVCLETWLNVAIAQTIAGRTKIQ